MIPKHIDNSFNRLFLAVLVAPMQRMRDEFDLLYSTYLLYRAHLTGQVAVFERHLNTTHDSILKRIYIIDTEPDNPITLYRKVEQSTNTTLLYRKASAKSVFLSKKKADTAYNYLIVLPDNVIDCRERANLLHLAATVNLFRCAGKAFGVKQFGQIFSTTQS